MAMTETRAEVNVDQQQTGLGGEGACTDGTHERGQSNGRDDQGGVSLSSGIATQIADPSAPGVVDQLNRVLTERGYPSVSAGDDIEFAVSQMVQDAQEGWTCFADAEACRVLQQKNSHHA